MNIILCGMPGCGKSYLGKMVASELKQVFVDTDELIMSEYSSRQDTRLTCREISLKEGEPYFRRLEHQVILGLKDIQNSVIAIGGGALCTPENIPILKELGWMIYLKESPEVLLTRLMRKDPLPSYVDPNDIEGSFNRLLNQRLPLYEQHCHTSVDMDSEDIFEVLNLKI